MKPTAFSSRHATGITIAALLVIAPIVYARITPYRDDCPRRTEFLEAVAASGVELIADASSFETGRLTAIRSMPERDDAPLTVAIAHAYGLPNLLLQPASVLPGRREPDVVEQAVLRGPDGRDLLIHYAYEPIGVGVRTTVYLMLKGEKSIGNPLRARLRAAPADFLRGQSPITLIAAATVSHRAFVEPARQRLADWILETWTLYLDACVPDSAQFTRPE